MNTPNLVRKECCAIDIERGSGVRGVENAPYSVSVEVIKVCMLRYSIAVIVDVYLNLISL
jgi:hypothetical protein